MENLVIGMTGGIGSGKSTVSKIIESEGYLVLYADDIAKNLMNEDQNLAAKIKNSFGEDCYSNGKLVPKVLASKVFGDAEKVKKLNSIVHPPTIKKIDLEISKYETEHEIIFVEVPLLFEAKMVDMFDYILLVTADIDTRIRRVLERDNVPAEEIKGRIESQYPEDQKRGQSDFIIDNIGSLEELNDKTRFFLTLFKTML